MKPLAFIARLMLLVLANSTLSGCEKNYAWNEKIMVSVETPDGVKSGESVLSVKMTDATDTWGPLESRVVRHRVSGEAVVLELEPGRYLFALLKGLPDANGVFFPDIDRREAGPMLEGLRQTRELTPDQYPLLVTFDDTNDPASVKRVLPDGLAATFGSGYRLSTITMSITDEPVTKGNVEAVLGWLKEPSVMENPGWSKLPIESRRVIGGLLSHFPKLKD